MFSSKDNFCGHRARAKKGKKEYCVNIFKKLEKNLKCSQDQVYLSPGSWYQAVQQTLNFSGYLIFYPMNVIFGMQLSFINLYNIFFPCLNPTIFGYSKENNRGGFKRSAGGCQHLSVKIRGVRGTPLQPPLTFCPPPLFDHQGGTRHTAELFALFFFKQRFI